ncbi:hypothetical protein [Paenibacillus larvae]|uniref:Uncharacterized protein n=2 Tax=Paenibacillus larvae subsp. larvae TaxID=147375 RepID=A0A6C0QQS7_9BACL|nr:hypothetical protein [Paenibacillus larvae]QHZ50947.1 hypothetical protein ERICV_01792 [Paenibacillus larvae subsp. larvae]
MAKERRKNKRKICIPKADPNTPSSNGVFFPENAKENLKEYNQKYVLFSWKFFDRWEHLFNLGSAEKEWYINLVDTLKSISCMKVSEFKGQRSLRVHSHKWDEVSKRYPLGSDLLQQIEQDTLQFAISKASGRVHGFVIDNVFYIVWLDKEHNLYPMQRHGGLTYCDYPKDCYECLEDKYNSLKNKYDELSKEHEELFNEYCHLLDGKSNSSA